MWQTGWPTKVASYACKRVKFGRKAMCQPSSTKQSVFHLCCDATSHLLLFSLNSSSRNNELRPRAARHGVDPGCRAGLHPAKAVMAWKHSRRSCTNGVGGLLNFGR